MKKLLLSMAAGAASVVFAGTTATWTGAENGFWTNANNWAEKVVPGRVLALDAGGNVITNGVKGDTAIFNGSEKDVKATTIDFDGLVSVFYIRVNGGAAAPRYTFGSDSRQIIPVECVGYFTVDGKETPVPLLTAGLSTGIGCDYEKDYNANHWLSVSNNTDEVLVINDFGFNTLEPGFGSSCAALKGCGTGEIRIDGALTKGLSYFGIYADCRKLTINHDLLLHVLYAHLPPSGYFTTDLEITAGHTVTMNHIMHSNGIRIYHGLRIRGEGRFKMSKSQNLCLYSNPLSFDLPIFNDSTDMAGEGGFKVTSSYATATYKQRFAVVGSCNSATGSVRIANYMGGVSVDKIGRKTEISGLGIGDRITIANRCSVEFLGAEDDVSDREIRIDPATTPDAAATGGVILQNGTGTLRMEGDISQGLEHAALILGGDSEKEGIWAGTLAENPTDPAWAETATLSVEKEGAGVWNLTAANTYSGATIVRGGTLKLSGEGSVASSSGIAFAGGHLELAGTETAVETSLPALSVNNGASAQLRLGRNRSARIAALPAVSGSGKLDVVTEDLLSALIVEGAAAGDAPAWLTVNGRPATFDANGRLCGPTTVWASAASGSWSEGGSWTAGAPDDGKLAYVIAEGEPYEVEIAAPGATAKNLFVRGTDAAVKVTSTGSFVADAPDAVLAELANAQACETESFAVKDGASLVVDGGSFSLTNYAGLVKVASPDPDHPSRVVVTNGAAFAYNAAEGAISDKKYPPRGRMDIGIGGKLEVSDSTVSAVGNIATDRQPILITKGGEIDVRGHSLYHVSREGDLRVFGTGKTTFRDDSLFMPGVKYQAANVFIAPERSGETAEVTFADESSITNYISRWWIGGLTKGGSSILNLDSSATLNYSCATVTEVPSSLSFWMGVGINYGYGELNMSAGAFSIGSVGLVVGGVRGGNNNHRADHAATGVLNLSGGTININGTSACSHGWGEGCPGGLTVGQGTLTSLKEGRPFVGTVNVTGGKVNLRYGHFLVGTGVGRGEYVQNGGTTWVQVDGETYRSDYKSDWNSDTKDVVRWATNNVSVIGFVGGEGRLTISNGTFVSKSPMYVGGASTNLFFLAGYYAAATDYRTGQSEFTNWDYWDTRHDADGKLTFAGGTFNMNKDLVLGADGRGELEMAGKADGASFTVGGLVLSNNTASVVRFVPDAKGVTPVTVTGGMTIAPGAKLVVDIANTTKRHFTLFTYASCDGEFAADDVEVIGLENLETPVIVTKESGLMRISIRDRGLMLIVR